MQRAAAAEWFGILNLYKPAGWSSRKAVDHVKKLVRGAKIGHAGTLDPLAEGVLVICLGPATRLVPYLHELSKTYRAKFLLGRSSPTDDVEGELQIIAEAPELSRRQIESALPQFEGEIQQVPPLFSAVKLKGQRAYKLARRGETADLPSRTVHVDSIRLLAWETPQLELEIVCGSGTYIRSIGRDLARSLGSSGVMSGLIRTRIGPFTAADAVRPEDITPQSLPSLVLPPQSALVGLSALVASPEMLERLPRGRPALCPPDVDAADGDEIAVLDSEQRLILIATVSDRGRLLLPTLVFAPKQGRA